MKDLRLLVLTDHSTHSPNNSVYVLARALARHPRVQEVFMVSRATDANRPFFEALQEGPLHGIRITRRTDFQPDGAQFFQPRVEHRLGDFDVVLLRLPHPVPVEFLRFLQNALDERKIINRPSGILETGSKAFLLNFPELCPPMQLCETRKEVLEFAARFPIVLKPIQNYGGRGVVRIEGERVSGSNGEQGLDEFFAEAEEQFQRGGYLGMKFLHNVHQGDKRLVVVNGQIVGAALRLPPEGAWLCNAAQGGTSTFAKADADERRIVETLNGQLLPRGIVFYGVDTLVGDDGRRVLSEINTLSIGGLKQAKSLGRVPVPRLAAELLLEYVENHVVGRA